MNFGQRLRYLVFRGLFSATRIVIGMAISPTTAQKDTFGEIICTRLAIVDENGIARVKLGKHDEEGTGVFDYYEVKVTGKRGVKPAVLHSDDVLGGGISIYKGSKAVFIYSGKVAVWNNDGPQASIGVSDDGGQVEVWGKGSDGHVFIVGGGVFVTEKDSDGGLSISGGGIVVPDKKGDDCTLISGGSVKLWNKDEVDVRSSRRDV